MTSSNSLYLEKAENIIRERNKVQKELEYSLKLQIEQQEQDIKRVEQHHQTLIDAVKKEYEFFKDSHSAHRIVEEINGMSNKVHRLEDMQHALLLYIKFGELR